MLYLCGLVWLRKAGSKLRSSLTVSQTFLSISPSFPISLGSLFNLVRIVQNEIQKLAPNFATMKNKDSVLLSKELPENINDPKYLQKYLQNLKEHPWPMRS
jgi:hypothetical protein